MRFLLFLMVFCLSGLAFGQDPVIQLAANIRDDDNGKKLGGVTIEVLADGKPFVTKTSASSGKVPLIDLPLGPVYTIKIKKPGYVTKIAQIDSHNDFPEDLPLFYKQPFQTGLFQEVEGVDFKFLETTPMIEFSWDSQGTIGWDKGKLKVMQKKIEDLKAAMEEKKKEQEKAAEEEKQLEIDFSAYVKAGDAAMTKEDYETAISQYQAAIDLKADATVQAKLDDAKKKWEDQKKNAAAEKAFSEKMEAAKREFDGKNYEPALALYKEAIKLKPDSKLAQDRITEIEGILANAAKNEAEYKKRMTEGGAALTSEDFDVAISKFEEALTFKPGDSAAEAKLAEAKKKKEEKEKAAADAKALQDKYDKLIADADKLLSGESYEEAKAKYQEALAVLPDEEKPKQKISEIDAILKKLKDEADAKAKLEEDYKKLITEADAAFADKDWEKAKTQYKSASALKTDEKYPMDQIDLINKELEKEASQAKKREEFESLMTAAKGLFDGKKYEEAKSKYQEASSVLPDETEPKTKIAEIDKILADMDKAAALEKEYNDLMTEGNSLQSNGDLAAALDKFKKALDVKAGDTAAQAKIDEINKLIEEQNKAAEADKLFSDYKAKGDEAFNAKNYGGARSNYQQALAIRDDEGIKAKLKEIDDLEAADKAAAELKAKYDGFIKEADDLFATSDYEAALTKYEEALKLSEERHPKDRILECQTKLSEMASAAEKEEKFNELVGQGDAAFQQKKYTEALDKYKQAIAVKPDPTISNKIAEIDGLIAAEKANDELDKRYQAKIEEADAAFNDENWNGAKDLYAEAVNIKDEEYPKNRIAEIDQRMKDEAAAETEKNYQKIISKADGLRDDDRLDEAISYYERALSLKPSDQYPKEQIDKIKKLKEDRAKAMADKEQLEKDYAAYIKTADESYNAENWSKALENYKNAIALKPDEAHPKSRIEDLKLKMQDAAAYEKQKAEYDKLIAAADEEFRNGNYQPAIKSYELALQVMDEKYPKDQIAKAEQIMKDASAAEIEKEYQKILTVAQRKFDQKDYEKAIELYTRAKDIRPTDPIPQQRIDEINQILSDMENASKNKKRYDDLITEADHLFESQEWAKAKEKYTEAYNLINEKYPENQIQLCIKHMNEKSVDEISKQYNKILSAADKYFDDQKYHKAKDLYERALTIKPGDDYPKQRLEEIEKILNPNKNIASSGGMKNYGNPDRSTNSVDVEALLLESEKQRRWISNKKASKQREDNEELLESLDILQEGHTFETKGEVEQMQVDLSQKQWSGEVQRSEAELMVEDLEVEMADVYDIWGVDNNDVVQLNRQAAQNIEIETSRINENSELARVEYIGDVELIKLEVSDEINSSTREQTDVVMENKEYVNRIEDEHVIKDLNNDVDRKNTEIHVEDLNIEIINKNLVKIWDQEDEVMNVKDMTELLTDERVASWVNSDIPRIDDVEDMKVLKVEFEETKRNQGNGQYDVTIEAKEYTEDMTTEMELENMNNDLPRQETEVAVENSEIEIGEFHDNLSAEQNNQLMNDKNELVDIEIEIEKNRTTYDQNREGYEVTVEEINEKLIDKHETDVENTTDESYATVDKVDGMIDKQINFGNEADSKSENNTDETISAVEDIIEKNGEISDGTDQHLAENEDYIESLKDINPNQIDEKMKNRLGTEFPEGVTEEIYTNKDEDGLMISYIVRRVVVRNGVGNFYEKVQTRFGTVSYSMNGKGITEFQWQNDTEAADLVRN
ncbi:MAG: hypothetical protein MI810_24210 [Flavobacteriales bacterium]|nr:hypothetical protein [Flavobacteriales bacterium]